MLTPTGAARTDERAGWSGNTATGRRDENPMSRRPVLPGGTDLGAINWRADECHTRAIDTTAALYRNRRTDNLAANGRRGRTGRLVRKYSNRAARTNVIRMQSTPRQLCTVIGGRITSRRTGGTGERAGWSENAAAGRLFMLTPTGAARTDERAGWSGNTATGRRDENPMSRRPVLPGGTDLGAINWRADECHTRAIDTTAALYRNRRTDGRAGWSGNTATGRRRRTNG